MEKFFSKIEGPLMKFGDKIGSLLFFKVIQNAFMLAFPIIVFGSLVTIIGNFPFLDVMVGEDAATYWKTLLSPVGNATINAISIFVCVGIGYYYAKEKDCDGQFCVAVCLCSFFLLMPWMTGSLVECDSKGIIPTNMDDLSVLAKGITCAAGANFGAKGMFVSIFSSFGTSMLFCYFTNKKLQIKMPDSVPPAVSRSFASLIPASLTLLIFLVIRVAFSFTPWADVFTFVYTFIQGPLVSLGSGFAATIVEVFFMQFFWFFGLHGTIIINSIMDPIWMTLMSEQFAAFQAGEPLPYIVTKPFMEVFCVGMGGTGVTIAVIISLVVFTRSKQLKSLGKLALPAAIFNVNEPFIFGLPLIFNPLVVIPWLLAPIVSIIIAYLAMDWGLVPLTTGAQVPWTTPIFLSGFLATNSWQGAVLQAVQAAVVGAIWFPFIMMIDSKMRKQEIADEKASQELAESGSTEA